MSQSRQPCGISGHPLDPFRLLFRQFCAKQGFTSVGEEWISICDVRPKSHKYIYKFGAWHSVKAYGSTFTSLLKQNAGSKALDIHKVVVTPREAIKSPQLASTGSSSSSSDEGSSTSSSSSSEPKPSDSNSSKASAGTCTKPVEPAEIKHQRR